jgi:AI-2 transport protein TqsA
MNHTQSPQNPNSPAAAGYTLELVRTTSLLVLAVLACGAVLSWLRPAVVPFLVALALYYVLSPISSWLVRRYQVSNGWGVLGAGLIGLSVVAAMGGLVWACLSQVTRDIAAFEQRLAEMSSEPATARLLQWIGFERDPSTGKIVLMTAEQTRQLVQAGIGWLKWLATDTFLVLVFLLFMLLGSSERVTVAGGLPEEVAVRVRRYLIEMFAFSVLTGVLVGGILGLLGVKFWLSFGFLAFVLNFIPTIGPITATLLPLPVVLLDPELPLVVQVLAFALPATVQVVVGNVIQPRFQSRTQGVHPVVTMLALIVFGMLWGAVGAVLAVPIAAVLKITFERIPGGVILAKLMAGNLSGIGLATGPDAAPEAKEPPS